jgi:hypothetical protein
MPPFPDVSPELSDFLKLCFVKDPRFRPSAATLFEHVWVRSGNPELQMLQPQDSVPFLRRVSMNSSRANSTRLFANDGLPDRSSRALSNDDLTDGARSKRTSFASLHDGPAYIHPRDGSGDDAGRAHTFIKTSFGQGESQRMAPLMEAIICRICHVNVRKVGVLCQSCGLIAHASCASATPGRCDAHEQAAIFARQQEYLQSLPSSRALSPRASHDQLDGAFKDLPARILSGLKRSTSALRNSPSPGPPTAAEDTERRRRLSGKGRALPPGAAPARPPLQANQDGSSQSRISRASMISNMSTSSMGRDDADANAVARRHSAIRFDLGQLSAGLEGKMGKGERVGVVGAPASPAVTPGAAAGAPPPSRITVAQLASAGREAAPHGRRESKSDCMIQ